MLKDQSYKNLTLFSWALAATACVKTGREVCKGTPNKKLLEVSYEAYHSLT